MHDESWFFVQLFPDNVLDVLYVADMYLLPGLKRLCGTALAKTICEDNVLEIWKTAKLFSLSRLEDQCKELMAKIIEKVNVSFCVGVGTRCWCCAMMVVYIHSENISQTRNTCICICLNILHWTSVFFTLDIILAKNDYSTHLIK